MLGVTHPISAPPPAVSVRCMSLRSSRRSQLRHVREEKMMETKAEQLQCTRATWLSSLGQLDLHSQMNSAPPSSTTYAQIKRGSFVKHRHSFNKANKQEAWEKIKQRFLLKLKNSSFLLSSRQIISIPFILSEQSLSDLSIKLATEPARQTPVTLPVLRAFSIVYLISSSWFWTWTLTELDNWDKH